VSLKITESVSTAPRHVRTLLAFPPRDLELIQLRLLELQALKSLLDEQE
jgi:hypothetical protein